jgi:hypothetical protein
LYHHPLKDFWGLPGADRGIDSLALNLSTAVQAKDYQDYVPLERLATLLGEVMRRWG